MKKLFCFMGWHSYFYGYDLVKKEGYDAYGTCTKYKCKWCEFEGMVDSQGNIF